MSEFSEFLVFASLFLIAQVVLTVIAIRLVRAAFKRNRETGTLSADSAFAFPAARFGSKP